MSKTCKEWIRNQLDTDITGNEFEARVSEKNSKKIDWLFIRDKNCIAIEDKEANDTSFEKGIIQLNGYYDNLIPDYKNIITIMVKELKNKEHKIAVFKNGLKLDKHPNNSLNKLDWYFNQFNMEFNKEKTIKCIRELNDLLHEFKIADNIRASITSTFLVCTNQKMELSDNDTLETIKIKVKESLELYCKDKEKQDLNKWHKIETLYRRFNLDLEMHKSYLDSKSLYEIWKFIKFNIFDTLENTNTEGYDIMSLFFTTFSRYALSNDKGQYFTPDHISDLMTDLLELNVNSKVLDPTCGSGTFLTKCMDKMINLANSDQQIIKSIKQNQIFGIELDETIYGLATGNMLLHKDGRSNIECGDCFDKLTNWIGKGLNRLIMNPPYSVPDKSELEFLEAGLNILEVESIAVIILPTSCALGTKFSNTRYSLMQKHSLKAVFTCPTDLFYPTGVNTCIMIWKAKVPHNCETYLADWKDDTHIKRRIGKKNTVRLDVNNQWNDRKKMWMKNYKTLTNGIMKKLTDSDSWLYETHSKVDYSTLCEKDFIETIRKYIAYKVENGISE